MRSSVISDSRLHPKVCEISHQSCRSFGGLASFLGMAVVAERLGLQSQAASHCSNIMALRHQFYRDHLMRYNSTRRSRKALAMTETEERLIAAAAIIGDSSSPVTG